MYRRLSDDGRVYRLVSMAWPNKRRAPDPYFDYLIHPVTGVACPSPREVAQSSGHHDRAAQRRPHRVRSRSLDATPAAILSRRASARPIPSVLRFAGADDRRLKALGIPFEHPKPLELAAPDPVALSLDGAVLDVFAGSGTTGHATWLANERDGGRRTSPSSRSTNPSAVARPTNGVRAGRPDHRVAPAGRSEHGRSVARGDQTRRNSSPSIRARGARSRG